MENMLSPEIKVMLAKMNIALTIIIAINAAYQIYKGEGSIILSWIILLLFVFSIRHSLKTIEQGGISKSTPSV